MDHDLMFLSLDLPSFPVINAVVVMGNVIVYRCAMPTCIWKPLRWLNVGEEKKFTQASTILDKFIYNRIDKKREEKKKRNSKPLDKGNEVSIDLLSLLKDDNEDLKVPVGHNDDKFSRDIITNIFLPGEKRLVLLYLGSFTLAWFCIRSKRSLMHVCCIM